MCVMCGVSVCVMYGSVCLCASVCSVIALPVRLYVFACVWYICVCCMSMYCVVRYVVCVTSICDVCAWLHVYKYVLCGVSVYSLLCFYTSYLCM